MKVDAVVCTLREPWKLPRVVCCDGLSSLIAGLTSFLKDIVGRQGHVLLVKRAEGRAGEGVDVQ